MGHIYINKNRKFTSKYITEAGVSFPYCYLACIKYLAITSKWIQQPVLETIIYSCELNHEILANKYTAKYTVLYCLIH